MFDRRRFLEVLAALGVSQAVPARATDRKVSFDSYPFTLGVASGYPHPDGMVLWTRLLGNLDPLAIPVRWEIAADEAMRAIVAAGTAEAQPVWAHSVHVEARGLKPDRWYWYRFLAGDAVSPVGRTRTAPAAGAAAVRLRFAFASCQHFEHGYYTAYKHMVADDLDLVVFLGDYIYESSLRRNQVRIHERTAEPVTLDEYRARYAQYKSDKDLQSAHRAFPWIVTWDDHEVDNDYANDRQEDGTPTEEFLLRRAAAYQAYYEHMPLPASMRPRGPAMQITTALGWGTLANFYLLDGRQYRSPQVCPRKAGGGNEVDPRECIELRNPSRTMLGAAQEAWLDRQFASSRASWNILAQPVLMGQRKGKSGEKQLIWTDSWDGYPAARKRVLESVVTRKLVNPVVISGDVHMHFVADLKLDFDDEQSPVVASEFVGTSITSSPGSWQRNMPAILAENPHIKYGSGNHRGYVRASIAGGRFHAELVGLETVKKPESRAEVLARFVVENGKAGPQKA
ncbi:MAG: alkaline phosphatase D family protein [Pseudomonadota bacterium]